jgi:phenylalanyl-tRNA synthetase beta chain
MKVSLKLAQSFSNVPLSEVGIDELVRRIGVQIGEVEGTVYLGPRYAGIVVAKVVSCNRLEGTDNLKVCMVDDAGITQDVPRNESGYVQVVCGAPNVKEGMLVAWLPPGVVVPSSVDKEPFTLSARDIKGALSQGMLASPSELGISDSHDGILEIIEDVRPGHPLRQLYGLDDTIVDIENKMFTHRPDCFGVLGVARELAGMQGLQFSSPDWYKADSLKKIENGVKLNISTQTELTPRIMAVAVNNVTITSSPVWLQSALYRVGIKPINNIVDVTNYLMYVTGQPLHAYDADKLPSAGSITARLSVTGEKVNLLNGKTVELKDAESVIIASGESAIGIGGVMGGSDTEVSDETKNIILECASFNMYNIRRTSMKYGLFTDAVTRFNKGQSTLQNGIVLSKAVQMVEEISGGAQSSNVMDERSGDIMHPATITVSSQFINERLGSKLSTDEMVSILKSVEIMASNNGDEIRITAPYWRTDLEIAEDIVEEIGRLHGYDKLPLVLPRRPSSPPKRNQMLDFKANVRDILSSAGANEVLTYSFVHGDLLKKAGQNPDDAYQISNALSPELQYYRMSIQPSLLDKVHANVKLGYNEFCLFEASKLHAKSYGETGGLPNEPESLGMVYANTDSSVTAYYELRARLDWLANQLGLRFKYKELGEQSHPSLGLYDPKRAAAIYLADTDEPIGHIGEYSPKVRRAFKLPESAAGSGLNIAKLAEVANRQTSYRKLSVFPSAQQDISLKVPVDTHYQDLYDLLAGELLADADMRAELTPLDIFQRNDDTEHLQYAFRLTIAHHSRTLKSKDVNALLEKAASEAAKKLGAERL